MSLMDCPVLMHSCQSNTWVCSVSNKETCGLPCIMRFEMLKQLKVVRDDENLVHYMATVFPDAESSGQMGNKYYQELERLVHRSFLSSPCSMFTPPMPLCFVIVCCQRIYTSRQSSLNTNGQPIIPGTHGMSDTKTIV